MVSLDQLKASLRQEAKLAAASFRLHLSDAQYSDAFELMMQGTGWIAYQEFIIPQLAQLLSPILGSQPHISVCEVGPGPRSVLEYLPRSLRQGIAKYIAYEPNEVFASTLEERLNSASTRGSSFPGLQRDWAVRRAPYTLKDSGSLTKGVNISRGEPKFDVVLFCHSLYGLKPKRDFIKQALQILNPTQDALVIIFHRDRLLEIDGLVSHRTALYPTGIVRIADNSEDLDLFGAFLAGFVMKNNTLGRDIQTKWRDVCRAMGRREETASSHLTFDAPEILVAFNRHATAMPELMDQVLSRPIERLVKNKEAQGHCSTSIVQLKNIQQIQQCVRWAMNHRLPLTVLGGGHSGHCLWPFAVSIDMSAFNRVEIVTTEQPSDTERLSRKHLLVVESGCKTEDVVKKAMAAGLVVPLGARPSVGAGLWLQGGIGHLSRLHGLACDSIVGAVLVSVHNAEIYIIGDVPGYHCPPNGCRPENEADLLWAIRGAGTNFGILINVIFEAHPAPKYMTKNLTVQLNDTIDGQQKLKDFNDLIARPLPWHRSADAYIYGDAHQLRLGVTMFDAFEASAIQTTSGTPELTFPDILAAHESTESKLVDGVGLFETDMYVSTMHGGHTSGKTSSFKRCLFLKDIGQSIIARELVAAVESRPSPLCYLHLLHGGGAVSAVSTSATAFGCRDWNFACVITGVWPRGEDGSDLARSAVQWVYHTMKKLLPLSVGVYGADLGPDPRDAMLAANAFGSNRPRLACLKATFDSSHILPYACPLSVAKTSTMPKLVILVTGKSCSGKDFTADIWASVFREHCQKREKIQTASISDETKRDYAMKTGASLRRLLHDRQYKEQHRSTLTAFYKEQVRRRPMLPQEHLLNIVQGASGVNVLLVTGMRDEAPVATFSHLVSDCRLVEVQVQATEQNRRSRQTSGRQQGNDEYLCDNDPCAPALQYRPCMVFNNDQSGAQAAKDFAKQYLLPYIHEDLQKLAQMVRLSPDFPSKGIEFRHVLGVSERQGGLKLCTSLLQTHFRGDWTKVDAIASCESGGFVFASSLASAVDVPLALIREAGKIPPPTISVATSKSHIATLASRGAKKNIEMERDLLPRSASVVVVDDVLSTGETACSVLHLLEQAGVHVEDVKIMVVAEFPTHRGRNLLRERGFGKVLIQSLLVFPGL